MVDCPPIITLVNQTIGSFYWFIEVVVSDHRSLRQLHPFLVESHLRVYIGQEQRFRSDPTKVLLVYPEIEGVRKVPLAFRIISNLLKQL